MGLEQSKHEQWSSKAEQLGRRSGSVPGMGRPSYRSTNELLSLPVTKTDGNRLRAQELAKTPLSHSEQGINLCLMEKRQPEGKHNPAGIPKWSQDKLAADGCGNESRVTSSGLLS